MGVGIEDEKENDAEAHEIHVDQEEDATVVEAPAWLHATSGVHRACHSDEGGDDEQWSGVGVGEVGEQDGRGQTGQDEETATHEGTGTWIEKARAHAILD